MRIAYFAPCFPPHAGTAAERSAGLVARWGRAGHDVVVVTDSARGWLQRERFEGANVVRTRVLPLALASNGVRGANVVIAASSPSAYAWCGWGTSELLRVPFVLELHDTRAVPKVLRARAGLVVSAGHAVVEGASFAAVQGIDVRRVAPAPRDTALRDELGLGSDLVVACFGAHTNDHLLAAARELPEIGFVLVGEGEPHRNVAFVPSPHAARIDRLVAAADVVVASGFDPPARVLEHLARARPVLLLGRGAAATIVEAAGAGWVVPRDDVDAIAEALHEAAADPAGTWTRGEIGRQYVEEHFDGDRVADDYLAALQRLARA